MSSGTGDRRNYEDLKAKLGLKKTSPAPEETPVPAATTAAPAAKAEPSAAAEHTPAGGFDLGLERGSTSVFREEEHGKPAPLYSGGGAEITLKANPGALIVKGLLLVAGLAAAAMTGYILGRSLYDREIAGRQNKDAAVLKEKIEQAQVTSGQPLAGAVTEHAALISRMWKKLDEVRSKPMSPEVLKSVLADLVELQKACIAYRALDPRLDLTRLVGDKVFNREALIATMKLADALNQLYAASESLARNNALLTDLEPLFDPAGAKVPSEWRTWRWMADADTTQNPFGKLVRVEFVKSKDGKVESRRVAATPAPTAPPVPGAPPAADGGTKVQIHVSYVDKEFLKDLKPAEAEEAAWVDLGNIVRHDVKSEIVDNVGKQLGARHEMLEQLMLPPILDAVDALQAAAEPIDALRTKTLETLTKLAGTAE